MVNGTGRESPSVRRPPLLGVGHRIRVTERSDGARLPADRRGRQLACQLECSTPGAWGQQVTFWSLLFQACSPSVEYATLVWCPSKGWTFVVPKTAWDEARGGSVSLAILDRRSNEAPGRFRRNPLGGRSFATRRRCSLLTDLSGYARRSRGSTELAEVLVWRQNSWPRMSTHLRDTTLARRRLRPMKHAVQRNRGGQRGTLPPRLAGGGALRDREAQNGTPY